MVRSVLSTVWCAWLLLAPAHCLAQETAPPTVATYAYLRDIALADQALAQGQVSRAEAILDRSPKELRQWEWHYLKRLCDSSLERWQISADEKAKCVLSPDGTKVALLAPAAEGKPRQLTILDGLSGKTIRTLEVPAATTSVAIHPDGTKFACIQESSGKPAEADLRDADSGKVLKTLSAPKGAIKSCSFSVDGNRLLAVGSAATVWDIASGKIRLQRPLPEDNQFPALSPDGKRLVYAIGGMPAVISRDGIVERHFYPCKALIWDASGNREATDKPVQTWTGGDGEYFQSLAFSPDGKRLAIGLSANKYTISVRGFPGGEELATLHGAPASPDQIRFSPDGVRVVAGCSDGTLASWKLPALGTKHRDLPPDLILHGHRAAITAFGFADANRVVSLDANKFVKSWDIVQSPRVVQATLTADDFWSRWSSPVFSPDGKRLLLVSSNGRGTSGQFVQVDTLTGKSLMVKKSRPLFGFDISYHPNGKLFVSTGADRAVHVCKSDTGETVARFTKQELPHRSRFTPDGEKVLVHSSGTSAVLWDWKADKILYSVSGFGFDHRRDYDFSSDGKYLAAASPFSNEIDLWDAGTGKFLRSIKPAEKGYTLSYVRFSPDSKSLASGQANKLTLWNPDDGAILWKPEPLKGKMGAGEELTDRPTYDVAFSPDGKYMAALARGRKQKDNVEPEVVVWDRAQRKEIQTLSLKGTEGVQMLCFSPDGQQLAAIGDRERLYLWNWKTAKAVFQPVDIDLPPNDFAQPTGLCFTPDGRMLAVALAGRSIQGFGLDPSGLIYFDRATGQMVSPFPEGHQGGVYAAAYAPDGSWYATGDAYGTVHVWDGKTGNHLRTLAKAPADMLWELVVSPDGKRLAGSYRDKGLKIWDIASGKEMDSLAKKDHGWLKLAFSPDSKLLAIAGYVPNKVLLRGLGTGKEAGELQLKGEKTIEWCGVAFHPDGKRLLTATYSGQIQAWPVPDLLARKAVTPVWSFDTHPLSQFALTPDGNRLVTVHQDGAVRLWDPATKQETFTLTGTGAFGVTISPDGRIIAATFRNEVKIWRASLAPTK